MIRTVLVIPYFLITLSGFWTCSNQLPLQSQAVSDGQLVSLRNDVKEIIRPECGSCHTSTLPTAKPGAVAAFDLVKDDWSGSMTTEQLQGFAKRTRDFSDSAKVKIDHLLAAEIAERGTSHEAQ